MPNTDLYQADIIDIDLNRGGFHRSFLNHSIGKGDLKANRFGVRLFRDGEALDLGAAECEGFFMSPHDEHIVITGSTYTHTEGNVAYLDLPQACYNYEGQFCLAIKVIDTRVTGTIRMIDGIIANTFTDNAVAPLGEVPTYQEVLALYQQVAEAMPNVVRVDMVQNFSAAQKAQGRSNIEAQLDVGFYIDGQGYLCQRINSDT